MNREFDFDELVDRRQVAALEYNAASMKRLFGEEDLFPSWVADMDFKAAPSVIACPRASLEKALGQLATAVAALPADAGR